MKKRGNKKKAARRGNDKAAKKELIGRDFITMQARCQPLRESRYCEWCDDG